MADVADFEAGDPRFNFNDGLQCPQNLSVPSRRMGAVIRAWQHDAQNSGVTYLEYPTWQVLVLLFLTTVGGGGQA